MSEAASPLDLSTAISLSANFATGITARLIAIYDLHTSIIPTATTTLSDASATSNSTPTARPPACHTHARTMYLSTVTIGLEAKRQILAVQLRQVLYTPLMQRAFTPYLTHLLGFRQWLDERETDG